MTYHLWSVVLHVLHETSLSVIHTSTVLFTYLLLDGVIEFRSCYVRSCAEVAHVHCILFVTLDDAVIVHGVIT